MNDQIKDAKNAIAGQVNGLVKFLIGVFALGGIIFGLGTGHARLVATDELISYKTKTRDDALELRIDRIANDNQLAVEMRALYQTKVDAELAKIEAWEKTVEANGHATDLQINTLTSNVSQIEKKLDKAIKILESK